MSDIVEQLRIAVAVPICKPAADEIESLRQQLAASQAREVRLREALRHLHHNARKSGANMGLALDVAKDALALLQDTAALEAMIAKAGECMRERCERESWLMAPVLRSIPGVTLEDIK